MIEKKSDSCEIFHLFLASRNLKPRLLDLSPNLNGTIRLPDTHGPPLPSPLGHGMVFLARGQQFAVRVFSRTGWLGLIITPATHAE